MPYKVGKNKRLINEVTLGEGYPLSPNLQPLKIGGENSIMEISSPSLDERVSGKVRIKGDLEVTGGFRANKFISVINAGFYNSGTSIFYLPLVGYLSEQSSLTSKNEYLSLAPPYNGRALRMAVRSEAAALMTTAGFHISNEGTEVPNSTASVTANQTLSPDDTTFIFDFIDANFVIGDVIAISLTPTAAMYDTIFSLVLEYEI